MKAVIIDVDGDGEVLIVAKDDRRLDSLLDAWTALDRSYTDGAIDESEWSPVEEYLQAHGITIIESRTVIL